MRCVIFDIDGTLSDVRHRLHYLEGEQKDWLGFFSDMIDDPPIESVVWLNQTLSRSCFENNEFAVIIVTARPDDYRNETLEWLKKHSVYYNRMYMRNSGDFRADDIVKLEILQQILEDGYEPFLVIDDRPQVVDMWRSYGISTLQCFSNESESRYDNQCLLTMMVGPSGAGKSTYTRNYKESEIVSSDAIRELHGWGHSPEDLKKTWNYIHGLISVRLKNGMRTILDATNIKKKDRDNIHRSVPRGQLVEYLIIDRDLDEKLRDRGWRSEELILKHHKIFKSQLKDILNADNRPNVIVRDLR